MTRRLALGWRRASRFAFDLLLLMKWRITMTAMFTGYAALVIEGHHHAQPAVLLPVLAVMALYGGCANTLNQIFERERDSGMTRTRHRRPLPAGRITPRAAAIFAVVQFAIATWLSLDVLGSPLGAAIGAFLVFYYSFLYTLWLKPRHWLNIVIGGVPGALGPPLAWALATGGMAWAPILLFLLIFLWTPPHVWALAIRLRDDYARAGIPMLPVVKGIDETSRQIFWYTVVMVAGSLLLPFAVQPMLWIYGALAVILGGVFLAWSWIVWKRRPMPATMPLFRFSIVYLFALFLGVMADAVLARGW
ncbi:protoheme IX farnesyltransferase [Planctomycetota bacterium]|nr:protoheme IX farnesyltransferase [Planctomycetota bacterium]